MTASQASPFPYDSVALWLARRAALTPDRVALETGGRRLTFRELDERAARCAGMLSAAGAGRGERVGALLPSGVEYIDLLFACARLGAILVPLSTRLTPPEVAYMVADAGCAALVYGPEQQETATKVLADAPVRYAVATGDPYERALREAPPRAAEPVAPDDTLAIFYTSGTTGAPKGAMLTHGNFFWTNLNMLLMFGFAQDERSLVVLPMFHVGGWNVNTLAVWWQGGTVVLEPSFDAGRALGLIGEGGITSMMGVPTIYQLMAEHPDFERTDFSTVRGFVCGGAPLPVSLIRRYQERGVPFIQGYGLTEAAPNCLLLPAEEAVRKAGAAGRPYFYTDVRIDGAGGTGEVIVRGPSVMKGYWNRPEETDAALRGGWLRTGDVGRIDEDGFITIVDRVKDMFISGGENVYPAEVENVLAAHPAVAEAAVIGVPHDRWGEAGRAVVVLREGATATADDIRSFCAERLAAFKVPASVVFADVLPRNPTGKLLKPEIRERFGDAS